MTPIEKIELSFNCDKDYSKMTPCSLGRHCISCDKTVIDFRKSDMAALTTAMENHGTICGLFTREQMSKSLKTQTISYSRIAAGFIFAFGLGVINNNLKAQNNASEIMENSHKFDPDTSGLNELFVGMIAETMPVYKDGGESGLQKFLKENLNYPSDSVQGKVYCQFTVDTTGKVIDPIIIKNLSALADKEVIRVIQLMEFIPGTQSGKKVQVKLTLPVLFNRDNHKKKK